MQTKNIFKAIGKQKAVRSLYLFLWFLCCLFKPGIGVGQTLYKQVNYLTIEQVIDLAFNYSNDAKTYRNYFLASYWSNRSFQARHLPSIYLSATMPYYSKQMQQGVNQGELYYYPQNMLYEAMTLSVSQNIPFTGGVLSFSSSLNRVDQFDPVRNFTYNSAPFGVTYSQSLTAVNWVKWDKKLSPLYFEEAKRSYLHNMEAVRTTAIAWFFNLMTAQQNLLMAKENLSNADTLYKISQKKYSKGSITKEELMQMKFSALNAEAAVDQHIIAVKANEAGFRSFMGIKDTNEIILHIPVNVPRFLLSYEDVIQKVRKNHVTPVSNERSIEQAKYNLATNQGAARPAASLYVSIGANQNAPNLAGAYKDIMSYQVVSLGLGIPIEDWGLRKGNVQMAKANLEALKGRVAQSEVDLDQSVYLAVMRYNMMPKRFIIATESDSIARERYDAVKERFIAGRISVTDLNIAQSERNSAQATYIYAIREFWAYYYDVQRMALFDFIGNKSLEVNFEELVKDE